MFSHQVNYDMSATKCDNEIKATNFVSSPQLILIFLLPIPVVIVPAENPSLLHKTRNSAVERHCACAALQTRDVPVSEVDQ